MKQGITPSLALTLGYLYPDQLNTYGDKANILALRRRCELRGIALRVVGLGLGDALAPDEYDMLYIGGEQDRDQAPVTQDLYEVKGIGLWAAIEDDMPVLAVCGGYQLLAHYYRPASGHDIRGLGVFDAWTIQKRARGLRSIGDIAINWNGSTLVGFENHRGRTYLGTARPLGKVLKGQGNNSADHTEGAVYRNTYGTYIYGGLLPKNPHFADHLLGLALRRSYGIHDLVTEGVFSANGHEGGSEAASSKPASLEDNLSKILSPLDDRLEWEAHAFLLERMGLYSAAVAALQAPHSASP